MENTPKEVGLNINEYREGKCNCYAISAGRTSGYDQFSHGSCKLVQSGYFTKVCVKDANLSLGVCMYKKNAELFHLPRALMVESSRPACAAAAVAAPIRKLCPAY